MRQMMYRAEVRVHRWGKSWRTPQRRAMEEIEGRDESARFKGWVSGNDESEEGEDIDKHAIKAIGVFEMRFMKDEIQLRQIARETVLFWDVGYAITLR